MTTTEALPDNRNAMAKQPATALVGYGLGDFACNLSIAMTTTFLLYYMTDVAGVSAAAVGTMFLIVRLWDAFTDLFAGRMVDKTMTRFGKFRPFLLWFAVPVLFLSFLNFNIPSPGIKWLGLFEWNLDTAGRLLYAYLAYAILSLVYSLINIPYGSLASAMTQSVGERAKLVAARGFGAAIGGVLLTYIISPQIAALQKTAPKLAQDADAAAKAAYEAAALVYRQNLQNIFTQTTLWFVVIGSVAFFLTFWFCRESVVRVTPTVTVRETFATLKSNKALAILCVASFFYLIAAFAVGGSTAYYAKYVMGDVGQTATMTLMNVGIALIITPLVPAMIKRLGKKTMFQYCGIFTIVGGVALFFVPNGALVLALIMLAVKGIGASLINTVMFGLEADTVEYGEWKSGRRSEGATYAIFSFTRKVTQSIGGAAGAWALAIGGYISASATDPNPVQPESAILAVKFTIGLFPALMAAVAMLVFWKYPLTDKFFSQIRDENEARKLELAAKGQQLY
jgi:glucuronide carrier protein